MPVTVPPVQKAMQHRAQQEQHVWQGTENMCPMLGNKKKSGNSQESKQHDPTRGHVFLRTL
jgi:hypothetical protein